MSKIINGREIGARILAEVKNAAADKKIKLAIIRVGDDPPTNIYVKNKLARAKEVGINTHHSQFDTNVTQEQLAQLIEKLNSDPEITGFFIQAPLPPDLNFRELCAKIAPYKDVDGLNPTSLGKLFHNDPLALSSATALAVMEMLEKPHGKHAVIISRSVILGKPLAALFLNSDCTVTVCHSKTDNLPEICKRADILVTATGRASSISSDFVKAGAWVIDCGAPTAEVLFDEVEKIAGAISPVPGGVGPVTIACLLRNCVKAWGLQNEH